LWKCTLFQLFTSIFEGKVIIFFLQNVSNNTFIFNINLYRTYVTLVCRFSPTGKIITNYNSSEWLINMLSTYTTIHLHFNVLHCICNLCMTHCVSLTSMTFFSHCQGLCHVVPINKKNNQQLLFNVTNFCCTTIFSWVPGTQETLFTRKLMREKFHAQKFPHLW